jgi:hypothetical protein
MKRTNIYLEEDQLRLLKHLAVEEGRSFTELVRQALKEFLEHHHPPRERTFSPEEWNRRLEHLLSRVRRRAQPFPPEEVEADVTAAVKESRRRRVPKPFKDRKSRRAGKSSIKQTSIEE